MLHGKVAQNKHGILDQKRKDGLINNYLGSIE